jgi:hypothetical protein
MFRVSMLVALLVFAYALMTKSGVSQAAVALTVGGGFVAALILSLLHDA